MASAREKARLLRRTKNNIPGFKEQNSEIFRSHHAQDTGSSLTYQLEFSSPAFAYEYSISHPAVSTVLTGTTNKEHLIENALAVLGKPQFSHI